MDIVREPGMVVSVPAFMDAAVSEYQVALVASGVICYYS
jgi:hypothetical protein